MFVTKELVTIPGVKTHTVGHLRVRLLEIRPDELYVLPESIFVYEANGYSIIRSIGKNNLLIRSSNFHTPEGLRSLLKTHLYDSEEHYKQQGEYFGLPIVARPAFLDPSELVSGYALPETFLTPLTTEQAKAYIEGVLVPGLIRNNLKGKEPTREEIENIMFFGNFMTEIVNDVGIAYISKVLDVSPKRLMNVRSSGKINYKHAVMLRVFNSDNTAEFYTRLKRANAFSRTLLVERQGQTGADFCEALRTLRICKGLTIFDMYKLTGISETTLSKYETGGSLPCEEYYYKMLEGFESVSSGSVKDYDIFSDMTEYFIRSYRNLNSL